MPTEVTQRLQEIRAAGTQLHERLHQLERWAYDEQAVMGMQADAGRSVEDLLQHQQQMLKAIQDMATTLDTWVSMNQLILERYLPDLVTLIIEESSGDGAQDGQAR